MARIFLSRSRWVSMPTGILASIWSPKMSLTHSCLANIREADNNEEHMIKSLTWRPNSRSAVWKSSVRLAQSLPINCYEYPLPEKDETLDAVKQTAEVCPAWTFLGDPEQCFNAAFDPGLCSRLQLSTFFCRWKSSLHTQTHTSINRVKLIKPLLLKGYLQLHTCPCRPVLCFTVFLS